MKVGLMYNDSSSLGVSIVFTSNFECQRENSLDLSLCYNVCLIDIVGYNKSGLW